MQERYMLIGTSHVAQESKQKIKKAFSEFQPDIIAIELDKQRYSALVNKEKSSMGISAIRQLGITGYLFALIGKFVQKRVGNMVGMNPGEEMLLGATLAKNNKLQLALIDQDVKITLRGLSKKVPFSEKMRMVKDFLFAPFSKQEKVKLDLTKVPPSELIEKLMGQMRKSYPRFYAVLVEDRNKYMAKQIFLILRNNPEKKIMAIVGAGHEEGIHRNLNSLIDSNIVTT